MAAVDGSQNEAYYIRLHLLIMEAQNVLRAKFDSIIKPADLPKKLKRAKRTLDKLKRDGIISKDHYKLLFPNPDSGKFDATLLTCLLQNICNLNPKDKAWVEKDNAKIKGYSDQENIQRIRNLRNKMQHKSVPSLEEHEFESSWNVLEKAMADLGTSCGLHDIQDAINHIRTKSLDKKNAEMINLPENILMYLEEHKEEKEYIGQLEFKNDVYIMSIIILLVYFVFQNVYIIRGILSIRNIVIIDPYGYEKEAAV